jgi:hypothetical protein
MGAATLLEKDDARKEEARLGALTAGIAAAPFSQAPGDDYDVYVDGVKR